MATAVNNAVPPAVSSDWLSVDTTAAERGWGPAQIPGPDPDKSPVVPQQESELSPSPLPRVPASSGYQYEPEGEGPWPYVLEGNAYDYPIQRPQGGLPQGGMESELPITHAPGPWTGVEPLQTYDARSQSTDTLGWRQNVPNDRISYRNTYGQANPLNNPTWYGYSENPVEAHLAVVGTDTTVDDAPLGIAGIANGSLPDYEYLGPQGNTVYNTPGPPPVSEVPATPAGSLIDEGWA